MRAFFMLEYTCLPYGEGDGCIPSHLAARLAKAAKNSCFAGRYGNGVIEEKKHGLCAKGVIGVIAADGCSLEILPKIDVPATSIPPIEPQEQEREEIRKRLVHMIAVVLDLRIDLGRTTELDWQRQTLLEILIRDFCDRLTEALRRGMPRRYLLHEDDLPALRGTLNLPQQLTRHAANPSRLACRFDELSPDIALNRIMKATVAHLTRLSGNTSNLQKLRELDFLYAGITTVAPQALRWDEVVTDRTNRAWHDLYAMAQLFLRNQYQTTSKGAGRGAALLFSMSDLFEKYIARLLRPALANTDFSFSLQAGSKYCLTASQDDRGYFVTRPDILIRHGGDIVQVIDTKWKKIRSHIDTATQGIAHEDIYQMMVYAQLYKAPLVTLLYPHHAGLNKQAGEQARYWINEPINETKNELRTASIDLADSKATIECLQALIPGTLATLRHNRAGGPAGKI